MDQTEALLRHVDERVARALPKEHAAWLALRRFTLDRFVRLPMKEGILAALDRAKLPHDLVERVGTPDAPIKEWAKAAKGAGRNTVVCAPPQARTPGPGPHALPAAAAKAF